MSCLKYGLFLLLFRFVRTLVYSYHTKWEKTEYSSKCQEITHKCIWWLNMNDKTNIIHLAVMEDILKNRCSWSCFSHNPWLFQPTGRVPGEYSVGDGENFLSSGQNHMTPWCVSTMQSLPSKIWPILLTPITFPLQKRDSWSYISTCCKTNNSKCFCHGLDLPHE